MKLVCVLVVLACVQITSAWSDYGHTPTPHWRDFTTTPSLPDESGAFTRWRRRRWSTTTTTPTPHWRDFTTTTPYTPRHTWRFPDEESWFRKHHGSEPRRHHRATTTRPRIFTDDWDRHVHGGRTDARGNPIRYTTPWRGRTDARGNPITRTRHWWDHHDDSTWGDVFTTTPTTTFTPAYSIITETIDYEPDLTPISPTQTRDWGRHSTVRPSEQPAPRACWGRKQRACVKGSNIGRRRRGKSLAQCKRLCAEVPSCKAIEFYHNYGGSKRSFKKGDCQLNFKLSTWGCDGTRNNMDLYYLITCKTRPTPQPTRPPNEKCVSLANRIQTKGCYNTRVPFKRGKLLLNWRHKIQWNKITQFASNLACACSEAAKRAGAKYFGIHFWGECWALERSQIKMAYKGDCTLADGRYTSKCNDRWNYSWRQECLGDKSYFVYKILGRNEEAKPQIIA